MPEQQTQAEQTTETQTSERNLLRGPVGFGPGGVKIENSDDLWRCASFIIQSGIAPKDMKTVQAVMVAISLGAELGMKPMSAIQNIAVINGRPSIWGDAMLGICRSSGQFVEEDFREWQEEVEGDGATAFCESRRRGGKMIQRRFSMAQAKRAGLLEKNTPWRTYPERMLMFRARSWCLRDNFGDVLCGMRASEEQMDCDPSETVEPAASSLDELADKLAEPAATTAVDDPPLDPPTDAEVADAVDRPRQAIAAEIYSQRIANAESVDHLDKVERDLAYEVDAGRVSQEHTKELAELVKGARARIGK